MSATWWAISAEAFLAALRRAHAGEDPDLLYAEHYANSDHEDVEPGEEIQHWLKFDAERRITGCHCGFAASPDDDGWGDSVVAHLLGSAEAERDRPSAASAAESTENRLRRRVDELAGDLVVANIRSDLYEATRDKEAALRESVESLADAWEAQASDRRPRPGGCFDMHRHVAALRAVLSETSWGAEADAGD